MRITYKQLTSVVRSMLNKGAGCSLIDQQAAQFGLKRDRKLPRDLTVLSREKTRLCVGAAPPE